MGFCFITFLRDFSFILLFFKQAYYLISCPFACCKGSMGSAQMLSITMFPDKKQFVLDGFPQKITVFRRRTRMERRIWAQTVRLFRPSCYNIIFYFYFLSWVQLWHKFYKVLENLFIWVVFDFLCKIIGDKATKDILSFLWDVKYLRKLSSFFWSDAHPCRVSPKLLLKADYNFVHKSKP